MPLESGRGKEQKGEGKDSKRTVSATALLLFTSKQILPFFRSGKTGNRTPTPPVMSLAQVTETATASEEESAIGNSNIPFAGTSKHC
jgi:hypothetical protein